MNFAMLYYVFRKQKVEIRAFFSILFLKQNPNTLKLKKTVIRFNSKLPSMTYQIHNVNLQTLVCP